jgi:HTH-type transcriptional regulator/antitoxin HigA
VVTYKAPAEVFPPGEFIRDELDARGWTQQDLAQILNRPLVAVNQIITGKRSITPDTAKALGEAFGTGPEVWLNLDAAYQLRLASDPDPNVGKRAQLFAYAPIVEMTKRNWIRATNDVADLELQIKGFFGVKEIGERPQFAAAARKSTGYADFSPTEWAWLGRVRQLGEAVDVKPYREAEFIRKFPAIRSMAGDPENIRHIPRVLAELGIRLVVVETLQKTPIDGAAMWLGHDRPMIALSMRFDRIDAFWHTIIHELTHIKYRDEVPIDRDVVSGTKGENGGKVRPEIEVRTDRETCEFLIPQAEVNDFITRVKPLFSKTKIIQFANRMKIHPGIVVGQLQHRREIQYSHSRDMLVPVRSIITSTALVDGWDASPGPLNG